MTIVLRLQLKSISVEQGYDEANHTRITRDARNVSIFSLSWL